MIGFLLLWGCGGVPPACDAMCAAGAMRAEECTPNQEDWSESCEVWAWEQTVLAREARRVDGLRATCAERASAFENGDCDAFAAVDWNAPIAW